jgi:F0F1-type ATP synthase assembly protein I
MAEDDPGRNAPAGSEEDIEAQIERIERELEEQGRAGRAKIAGDVDRFFNDPPHPGPVPETLRSPVATGAPGKNPSMMAGIASAGAGWGLAFDFIATILTGLVLGWALDHWGGTRPWGILAGLGLGFLAAFVRIIRATQRADRIEAARRGSSA